MKAIVVGAGVVGFDVAKLLSHAEHDVVVIDIDAESLSHVNDKLDVMTIVRNATSTNTLEQAGIRDARMLIAVTAIDEVNIIACMLADRLGVPTTVARVRSDELSNTQAVLNTEDFGIDLVIHPEESAANEVIRLIRRASATDVIMLADDRLHLVGLRLDPDSPAIGRSIQDLSSGQNAPQFRIMALARGIRTILPTGDERLRKNDQVFILGRPKSIPPVLTLLGKSDRRIENVMILGGSEIGAKVAFQLSQEKHKSIKLIVSDRQRAEELAELLGSVLVIHGEHTDIDLLVTEGLSDMDAFVAVTNDEESNLVTCLLAKHLQVRKTVGLLSKGAYIPISQSIGLDAAVNKKLAVSREIMRFLRGKHVKSVASVHGLDAEILEIEANQNAAITQDMLMNVSMPRGVLIAALIRGKNVEIATGLTQIEAGDRVYVFVLPESISKAERLFERR